MYHLGVPIVVKQWIDYDCRPGQAFQCTQTDPKVLMKLNRACLVTTSGGTEIGGAGGHVSRYLEQVCGFVGAQDVQQIAVGGSNGSAEAMRADARAQIDAMPG